MNAGSQVPKFPDFSDRHYQIRPPHPSLSPVSASQGATLTMIFPLALFVSNFSYACVIDHLSINEITGKYYPLGAGKSSNSGASP